MKKIIIKPGCITCGACEFFASDIFEVRDIAHVKEDADFINNEDTIKKAIKSCPVGVISYEESSK